MQIAIRPLWPVSMKIFRRLSLRYRDHNMTHSIKYVKRHTPSKISLNGFWKRFRWEREEEKSSHSPEHNGHFHYCCAVFTNNKFHTRRSSGRHELVCEALDSRFNFVFACSFFGQCSLVYLSCLLLVSNSYSPCLCRILFGPQTRSAVFNFFCCRSIVRRVTRPTLFLSSLNQHQRSEAFAPFPAAKKETWVVKRQLQTTILIGMLALCHIKIVSPRREPRDCREGGERQRRAGGEREGDNKNIWGSINIFKFILLRKLDFSGIISIYYCRVFILLASSSLTWSTKVFGFLLLAADVTEG